MPSPPIAPEQLDLRLAWRRAIHDIDVRRAFVRHPFHDAIIAVDLDVWLGELSDRIARGAYVPGSCGIVPIPKPFGHIRPGADLRLSDRVVYAALVQNMRPAISGTFGSSSGSRVYSYHLRDNAGHSEWFEPFYLLWRAFDRDSILSIDEGARFVVVADVAGFYENIDLNTLRSDLNGLGVDASVLHLVMECLNRWPRIQRRGVPQGHGPSDILARLYLHPVDLILAAEGFNHRRWVDDFRIFCRSESEARRALARLADTLGRRGLVLQAQKSRILTGEHARARFSEVNMLLDPIQTAVAIQLVQGDGAEPSCLPPWVLDAALPAAGSEGAVEVLRTAMAAYFLTPGHDFNKTLFHYLLRRLGAAEDGLHAAGIVSLLRWHPEEFDHIAEYCTAVGRGELLEAEFLAVWNLGLIPYPYMGYQFFRWRLRENRPLGAERGLARAFALEPGHPWFLRAVARSLLGKFGDAADLESMEAAYAGAQSDLERAEVICALQRMESGRRNALYGRAAGDGPLTSRAVRMARTGDVRWGAC